MNSLRVEACFYPSGGASMRSDCLGEPAAGPASAVDVRRVRAVADPLGGDDRQAVRHLVHLGGVLAAKMLELRIRLIHRLDPEPRLPQSRDSPLEFVAIHERI